MNIENHLPMWKKQIIEDIKNKLNNNYTLTFIHTPKCAGTYASHILSFYNIKNNGHTQFNNLNKNEISFTIIRDPIKRFESFLNFRLNELKPRHDFFKKNKKMRHRIYNNTEITLNEIVENIKINDISLFSPYKTLRYWTKNVDLIITIDELNETLKLLGYNHTNCDIPKINVSLKKRGMLNARSIAQISKYYKDDIDLYNYWTRRDE